MVMKLVHRHSIVPPDYLEGSIDTVHPEANTEVPLIPNNNNNKDRMFLVKFSIGKPPIVQYAYMDTGSNLLWLACNSTNNNSTYDPRKSSSYKAIPCSNHLSTTRMCILGDCFYQKHYGSGESSSGVLAMEDVTLQTMDEWTVVLKSVRFGCSHHQSGQCLEGNLASGIFGLSVLSPSILDNLFELGSLKFSYCTGDINDPSYAQLTLGDGADTDGDETPLHIFAGRYYLTLDGISLGNRMLNIDPSLFAFKENVAGSGVVIDTGSKVTILPTAAYDVLYYEMKVFLDKFVIPAEGRMFCYKGTVAEDLAGSPLVKFHFAWGAELVLDPRSLFYQLSRAKAFCLAVKKNSNEEQTIIGMMAQQVDNVGFDLQTSTLSLQKIDCEFLEDS